MLLLNNIVIWIRDHFPINKVNKFSTIIIIIYYYIGLLSYISVPIQPIYHFFTSSSSVGVFLRAVMTAMIILYSLLVVIVNKEKVQWKWAVIFVYLLLLTLISTLISPQTYNYVYVSNSNYGVVYWVQVSTGFNRLFTMYLSSISDFALAFCFLFILPIVINDKKQILAILLPIVAIGLMECGYSIIIEKEEYIKLYNYTDPQFGGYNIDIGASFGNKQDWGAFSAVAFTSALVSFVFIEANSWKKVVLKIALFSSSLVIFAFTIASLCKTAIFSEVLLYVFCVLCLLHSLIHKKHYVLFIISVTFLMFLLTGIILFYFLPSLHESGLMEKIYNVTYNFIIGKVKGGAAEGRTVIWVRLIENFRTYNIFFGLSKGGASTYSQVVTVEGQSSIHNGIAYFFASYGLLGFSIYLILFVIVGYRVISLWKINPSYMFILLGALGVALVFSLAEAEVLIVSGSNPIFIFNVLLCILPQGLLLKYYKKREIAVNGIQLA